MLGLLRYRLGVGLIGLVFLFTSSSFGSSACVELFVNRSVDQKSIQEAYPSYPDLQETYEAALALVPAEMKNEQGNYIFSAEDKPVLTVVIPAYREAKRLPASILKIKEFFTALPFPVEIMIRIEKSPDDTVEATELTVAGDKRFVVFPHTVQRGKGYAVREGMLAAYGDYVLFMDADLSTPLPEIYKFLAIYAQNPENSIDVLIGDRRHPESNITSEQTLKRQVMGAVFRKITTTSLSAFGLKGICDTQCGFKMFTHDSAQDIFGRLNTDGFAFDVEALMFASLLHYQVKAAPVQWVDDKQTTVNPIIDPIKMLLDVGKLFYSVQNRLKSEQSSATDASLTEK
jgi:dolichyl-phosphate beta-glucosyltransferase